MNALQIYKDYSLKYFKNLRDTIVRTPMNFSNCGDLFASNILVDTFNEIKIKLFELNHKNDLNFLKAYF